MQNTIDISFWSHSFGLLPILLDYKSQDKKYLMLNGGNKDFCIHMDSGDSQEKYFSDSWSTNTKNLLSIDNDNVTLFNWNERRKEPFKSETILNNPDRFYNYLTSKSFKTSFDAVPFIIDIFRQLRNLVGKKEPEEALNLLFKLLISIQEDYSKIDTDLWKIADVNTPSNFDYYIDLIRGGVNSIQPNLDLILRHISGSLFQEAHKEILYFDSQLYLWGSSSKLETKKELYSSVHYTPSFVARTIVENSLNHINLEKENLKIFDPACGSSEFLMEVLKQLKNKNYRGKVTVIGWDSSPSAKCTSDFLLNYEKRTQWNNKTLNYEIKLVENSLSEKWDDDYDLIIMNPPFVAWERLSKGERDIVMNTFDAKLYNGKPNQASAFLYKALNHLSAGGVIGCILPTPFFTSETYINFRNRIKDEFEINILAKLGNYVFEHALTDVSFIVATKRKSNILPEIIWVKDEKGAAEDALSHLRKNKYNNQLSVTSKNFSIYTPNKFPILKDSWKLISAKEEKFLNDTAIFELNELLLKTSKVFNVKQGIRTGNNVAFIISLEEYEDMPFNEKKYYRKVINNDTINKGYIRLINYVWYPYDKKGMMISDENSFQQLAPNSHNRLVNFKDELAKRARKGYSNWWHLSEHRAWLRNNEPRLYSTEYGKAGSFAFDKSGEFVAERSCAWIPKNKFTIDDYYFYLSFFSSDIFDFLLSIYSKPIKSGYYLGKTYTKDIPIPSRFSNNNFNLEAYDRLVELGVELSKGNFYVKHAINDVVQLYYPQINYVY